MIIVDTDVWIDHLRAADPALTAILSDDRQRVHPYVVGEPALGGLLDRERVVAVLEEMQQAEVATHDEAMRLIAAGALHGLGIGYVDAHLIASARLTPGARVLTRDKRLAAACDRLGLSFRPPH